jgi:hypothetical protein
LENLPPLIGAPGPAETRAPRPNRKWLDRLAAESKSILARLPNLDDMESDSALMLHVNLPSSKEVIRDANGRITAIQFKVARFPGESGLSVAEATEADDGFRMVSRILVESLAPALEADPKSAMDDLVGLFRDPSPDLDPQILRAARWQASLLLDRMNLDDSQVAAISVLSLDAKDDVLKGMLMAAAARYPATQYQVRNWLVTETSERALKAALGKLAMTQWRYEYSSDAEVQVTDLPGNQSKIVQRGGLNDYLASPDTAADMGSEILQVLTRLLQTDSSALVPRTAPDPAAQLWAEKYYGVRTDLRHIALQSLQGRVTSEQVPHVMSLFQAYPEPSIQKEIVEILGRTYVPEAAQALSSVIENKALPIELRTSALSSVGLMRHGTVGQEALERALHSDIRLAIRAASRLGSLGRPVAEQTLERLSELSKNESEEGATNLFRNVYEKLRALK